MTLALALLLAAGADPTAAPPATPAEQLRDARSTFDFADYARAAPLTDDLLKSGGLTRTQDLIEANRILGLSRYYLHQPEPARKAFLDLLLLDPDYQLDAFYVPPDAITFFESVRSENQEVLEPIRVRRQADAQRLAEEARRTPPPPVVREQVEPPKHLIVALLPGGAGQFQNGNPQLGLVLAASEALLVAIAVGCQLGIESLRLPPPNQAYFSDVQAAKTLQYAQVTAVSLAGLLWILGATEAVAHLNSGTTRQADTAATSVSQAATSPRIGVSVGASGADARLTLSF
jgi:hypothetical protein